ncbi:S-adenosyl-L-methionine-dependent tRNA 4-demethylwyosine synthase [Lingula anatina]|uniref:S-adenosyl-L-methionine-dependent tRNA 4-demethylwyosine synthase TYW1 n=1 Tax=Lingula anatina TaxID=7574 RepID=A0A1S3KHL1_LINAN|nr:S-adenosyl-L-methionine-dependent tRNA 4-demethylwyosine synthase [Lingula anatina]|eukprot:XP_013421711.1 S-adenosyl-L-methionine-dependent tRNA 4-demethylwyosine synthase [Lingula anatina]
MDEGTFLADLAAVISQSWLLILLGFLGLAWLTFQQRKSVVPGKPKRRLSDQASKNSDERNLNKAKSSKKETCLKIFFGTQTGTAKTFADIIKKEASEHSTKCEVIDLKTYDPEDNITDETDGKNICVFIISTYTEGSPPDDAAWFYKWLEEAASDFRIQKTMLQDMRYCVVGLGNSLYKERYNKVARNIDHWFHKLSANRVLGIGLLDENVASSKNGGIEADFEFWKNRFWSMVLGSPQNKKDVKPNCGTADGDTKEMYETSSEEDTEDEEEEGDGDGEKVQKANGVVDVEDIGKMVNNIKKAKAKRKVEDDNKSKEPREMITPLLRTSLQKQGYRLIGSHSGVKLCRWTKSMLRGRGGCYKHTFYGIESHRCMETTPSLACANKCVFCWRHHTNPVGTEWRWKMDDPELILEGALQNHCNMIKQFKGVPGVKSDRFTEGLTPKHCALSLVGEPIMYPEINKFAEMLHSKGISSFLVTNAQFPDAIRNLTPVTQLYVSVDASTKESLKKIDRPLFRDYWERFLDSLKALSEKGQRTVYRLTLVKNYNTEDIENYASLVSIGKPDFIEIKGVTYCGESKASRLTMDNVPWHEEVIKFVQDVVDRLPDYAIASEHEHSNCVLVAHKKFQVNGDWWTWIDYDRFHELVQMYKASEGQKTFSAADYMAQTPHWAVFGADERGFDPGETRFMRKKTKDISGC